MWEQTRNNTLYLCERTYEPLTGRQKIVTVKISKDTAAARKEAQKRLRAKLDEYKPKRLHLSDLIDRYERELEKTVRDSTYARNCCALNTMLSILDDVYLDKLTAGYVRMKLIESGKENSTMNELIKRFKAMLLWGYRNDYIGREVADKLTKFPDKTSREKVADKFLEKKELQILLDAFDLERHKLVTEFLALSGLRYGEMCGLNDEDVDDKYIHVTKSYSENFSRMGDPKTQCSIRDVYIQPELMEVVKKIRICMKKQRMMYGYEDKGYFVSGIDGGRLGYAAYAKQLKIAAKKAGIDKTVTPHVLRHTMTSLFAEQGVPLEVISRRLGHESSDLTKTIYLHITKIHKEKDNQKISGVTLLA
jgi:integrase